MFFFSIEKRVRFAICRAQTRRRVDSTCMRGKCNDHVISWSSDGVFGNQRHDNHTEHQRTSITSRRTRRFSIVRGENKRNFSDKDLVFLENDEFYYDVAKRASVLTSSEAMVMKVLFVLRD